MCLNTNHVKLQHQMFYSAIGCTELYNLSLSFSIQNDQNPGAPGGFAPWSPTRALPWTHKGTYAAPLTPGQISVFSVSGTSIPAVVIYVRFAVFKL